MQDKILENLDCPFTTYCENKNTANATETMHMSIY